MTEVEGRAGVEYRRLTRYEDMGKTFLVPPDEYIAVHRRWNWLRAWRAKRLEGDTVRVFVHFKLFKPVVTISGPAFLVAVILAVIEDHRS